MKDSNTVGRKTFNGPGDYRIEVSGWGADNSFFVEQANLVWTARGEKQLRLLHELPAGAVMFVRPITGDASNPSVPVAFRVKTIKRMVVENGYQVELLEMHPRQQSSKIAKESPGRQIASNGQEAKSSCETNESGMELEHEEILR
ncbi:MAG TPA: hypothetical protein VFE02_11525 [Candidatus Acidoferrales bacterium]|jgi:hypothetical protein|nr:hypothetical protein [Candidatus Acidoferrales bacterium]